ncbi:MAG: hypothetical protein JXR81_08355 [Candidatus Goldbacteria bacterium]|nr:hypothetical protein [Candidatus Goldiibacteriota bacterium]
MSKAFDYKKAKEKMKIINPKQINLKEMKRVIILAPRHTEDFILATPALNALKEALAPEGEITIITTDGAKKIAYACPAVSLVKPTGLKDIIKSMYEVCREKYDLFICFEDAFFYKILFGLIITAKAKLTTEPKKPDKLFNSVYNLSLRTIGQLQHKIIKYMSLVRYIGANSYDFNPRLRISQEDKQFAARFIQEKNINCERPIIGIHPTCHDRNKRWSFNKFSQVVSILTEQENCTVIAFHHKEESGMFKEFMHITKNKCVDAETYDYMKIAAVSRYLSCFVTNETDYMHLAAPFTNVIAIWGNGDPENNKPSGTGHEVLSTLDGAVDSVPVSKVLESIRAHISAHHHPE